MAALIAYVRRRELQMLPLMPRSHLVKLIHVERISTVYEKVILLALVVNAVFGVFVLLPTAHGKASGEAAQPQENIRAEAEAPSLAEVCALRESHAEQLRGD